MSKRKIAAFAAALLMTCGVGFSGASAAVSPFSNTAIEAEAADSKGTEAFVTRMYDVVLGRKPDAAGLKNWTSQLNSKKKTAADIVNGFFFSDEYKGKKKSNSEMVTDCYKAMLDRSPDSNGMTTWTNRLAIGMTIQSVCKGFVGSNEFKGLCASYGITPGNISLRYVRDENFERTFFVYRLYMLCLGREPDIAGLENWCKSLKNGTTGVKAAQGFLFSKELREELYNSDYDMYTEYVYTLYGALLGRAPDTKGMDSWRKKLEDGASFEHVTNGFLFSNEFKQQCAKAGIKVGSKLAAPEDDPLDKYPAELISYINNERKSRGLQPLSTTPQLSKAAAARAKEVDKKESHTRPDGSDYATIFTEYGAEPHRYNGESVVKSMYFPFNDLEGLKKLRFASPKDVIEEGMKSSTTKENMLNTHYKYIGVGVVSDKNNNRSWAILYSD